MCGVCHPWQSTRDSGNCAHYMILTCTKNCASYSTASRTSTVFYFVHSWLGCEILITPLVLYLHWLLYIPMHIPTSNNFCSYHCTFSTFKYRISEFGCRLVLASSYSCIPCLYYLHGKNILEKKKFCLLS